MKKFIAFTGLFFGFCFFASAEKITKEYEIDNLYSIELTIDTELKSVRANLFSVNSDVFDENYAEECFNSEVEEISNEYGFSDFEMTSSTKTDDYKGKYTMMSRMYSLK